MKDLKSNKKVFVIGAGFIGEPLANSLHDEGFEVMVSKRQNVENQIFTDRGIQNFYFEVGNTMSTVLPKVDVLVIAYPFGKVESQVDIEKQAAWIYQHFNHEGLKQVVHCSSTGVYQDGFGEVTENNENALNVESNQWVMEQTLGAFFGDRLTVFRLAGLIGETRKPGRFLGNKRELPNPNSPVNLVHQKDVVRFMLQSIKSETKNECFNLCYPSHPTRKDYYSSQAVKLGFLAPTFTDFQIDMPKIVNSEKSISYFGLNYENSIEM